MEKIKIKIKARTIFACMWYGTACYLLVTGEPLPDFLKTICLMLMSFFFGQHIKRGENNGNTPSDKR